MEGRCTLNSGCNLNEKLIWSSTKGNPTNAPSVNPTHVRSSHTTNVPTLSLVPWLIPTSADRWSTHWVICEKLGFCGESNIPTKYIIILIKQFLQNGLYKCALTRRMPMTIMCNLSEQHCARTAHITPFLETPHQSFIKCNPPSCQLTNSMRQRWRRRQSLVPMLVSCCLEAVLVCCWLLGAILNYWKFFGNFFLTLI